MNRPTFLRLGIIISLSIILIAGLFNEEAFSTEAKKKDGTPNFDLPLGWQYAEGLYGLSRVALAPEIEGVSTRTSVMVELMPFEEKVNFEFKESEVKAHEKELFDSQERIVTKLGMSNFKGLKTWFGTLPENKGIFVAVRTSYVGLEEEKFVEETRYIKCSDSRMYLGKIISESDPKSSEQMVLAQKTLDNFKCPPEEKKKNQGSGLKSSSGVKRKN